MLDFVACLYVHCATQHKRDRLYCFLNPDTRPDFSEDVPQVQGSVGGVLRRDTRSRDQESLEQGVEQKLKALYLRIFSNDLLAGRADFARGILENEAAFELALLAYYQLSHETGNTENQPIDINRDNFRVQLYKKDETGEFRTYGQPYLRRTDILLQGGGADEEVLVEGKSYKRPKASQRSRYFSQRFAQWDLSKGKKLAQEVDGEVIGNNKGNHKQFFLDRVAISNKGANDPIAGDFKWWFHAFSRKTIDGYDNRDAGDALEKLKLLPRKNKIGSNSLGLDKGNPTTGLGAKVQPFGIKTVLLEEFKDRLFDGVDDELYDTLVRSSTHDL